MSTAFGGLVSIVTVVFASFDRQVTLHIARKTSNPKIAVIMISPPSPGCHQSSAGFDRDSSPNLIQTFGRNSSCKREPISCSIADSQKYAIWLSFSSNSRLLTVHQLNTNTIKSKSTAVTASATQVGLQSEALMTKPAATPNAVQRPKQIFHSVSFRKLNRSLAALDIFDTANRSDHVESRTGWPFNLAVPLASLFHRQSQRNLLAFVVAAI